MRIEKTFGDSDKLMDFVMGVLLEYEENKERVKGIWSVGTVPD